MKRSLMTLFFLWATPAPAYELEQVLDNIEKADKSVQSIRFDFVQDVHFIEMKADSVVKGEALFAKPNRLRIEKQLPDKQVTVSNGKKLWVYNPAFKQVWEGTWKSWVEAKVLPQGLVPVGGYVQDLRKRFKLSMGKDPEEGVVLVATPKEKDLGYSLQVVVSTETWMPTRTVFRSDSAIVETALSQVRLNPVVTESEFKFTPPPGVDVIPLN